MWVFFHLTAEAANPQPAHTHSPDLISAANNSLGLSCHPASLVIKLTWMIGKALGP